MKITLAASALLLAAALAGCSAQATPAASQSPTASTAGELAGKVTPTPNAEQAAALQNAIAPIVPTMKRDKITSNSRNTCRAILDGSDDASLVKGTKARFDVGGDAAPLTDVQAQQILAAVKANGFCKA